MNRNKTCTIRLAMNSHGPHFRSLKLFAGYDIHLETGLTTLEGDAKPKMRGALRLPNNSKQLLALRL
jgi:hypothetical protein